MRLSKQEVDGTLYVDGKSVDSGQLTGSLLHINSLERLFLGGVPKDFDTKQVPVSRFAASLSSVPCHGVDSITGGGGGGWQVGVSGVKNPPPPPPPPGRGKWVTKPIGWNIYDPR